LNRGQLASVREGHTITVTDHGRPVARIVPVGVPTKLEQLISEGKVAPARRRRRPLPRGRRAGPHHGSWHVLGYAD